MTAPTTASVQSLSSPNYFHLFALIGQSPLDNTLDFTSAHVIYLLALAVAAVVGTGPYTLIAARGKLKLNWLIAWPF